MAVRARLVPRCLWTTAAVEVWLENRCILTTGGQMKFTGAQSAAFIHAGAPHTAELIWGMSGVGFSIPYRLQIDGLAVSTSRAQIHNWPLGMIPVILVGLLAMLFFHFRQGNHLK